MQNMKQMKLLCLTTSLLGILCLTRGKISEYQLETETLSQCEQLRAVSAAQEREHVPQCSEDGRFRHVQCNRGGGECWCVSAEGLEIPGSRHNGSTVHCLTSCQLQRQRVLQTGDTTFVPVCQDSGEYEQVQCDTSRRQCWCVDQEGMEIYGTRQNGKPSKCPGTCEVRQRRILHGIGEPSPPQCLDDGGFLPVQCKFVNTTDRMVFDLLHTFNRMPQVFQTFSGFRKAFPEVSSYCFCADSRGREMQSTGVELLLDEVYDTAFSDQTAKNTFSQSNMYRILQRRYLAVQLSVSGKFRCPTPCESERAASAQNGNFFVPSCADTGAYVPTQCQTGGQCWCVDADGKEIFGTRQYGVPQCSTGVKDCPSERRRALSGLFYGPAGDFGKSSVLSVSKESRSLLDPCSPEFQELLANSGLLESLPDLQRPNVGDILAEVLQGMFPSGALALKALALTPNPKRLQENLFGGKFLKNAGNFNFTGAVGTRGTLSFSQVFGQIGLTQTAEDFMQLAKNFLDNSASVNLDQVITDAYGRSVNLKHNREVIQLVSLTLENQQFLTTLRETIKQLKAEENIQLGQLFRAVFQNPDVCKPVTSTSTLYVPRCTEDGRYQDVQCQGSECWCVDSRGLEILGSRSTGPGRRCPSQCEEERKMAIAVKSSSSAGSEVFIPKCESNGAYVTRQCVGKSCFCVDRSGTKLQISGSSLQCPTSCQATAVQQFLTAIRSVLSDLSSASQLSDIYIPRCASDGSWHQIQCDGPSEQAFEFYRQWIQITGEDLPVSELLGILRAYARNTEAMATFRAFLSELFKAGHYKVFPALASFEKFSDIPSDMLDGNVEAISGPSVFLNPLSLWRLISGDDSGYPGPLSDFSVPLGSVHLRQCWCVNQQGDLVAGSKVPVGQIPKCPDTCSAVHSEVSEFLKEAEELISLSNSSYVPVGYGFLLAESVHMSPQELEQMRSSKFSIAQTLLSNADSALRLAAHSTLHFYWQTKLMSSDTDRQSLSLGYQPYIPQCDAYGQWLPSQCYPSTGHCWCVDEDGRYIDESLTSRSTPPQQCQTTCQRLQNHFLLSDWTQTSFNNTYTYSPLCDEDGEFSVFQKSISGRSLGLCVSPITGKIIQPATVNPSGDLQCPGWCSLQKTQALQRDAGLGYEPQCVQNGERFAPFQCDLSDCWCVTQRGKELPATRTPRSTGLTPSCDIPECPLPFGDISHGAILCGTQSVGGQQTQRCELFCDQGYANALPVTKFLCDPQAKSWLDDAPLSHACQRSQVLQTVQVNVHLQVTLAEGQQSCSTQSVELQASFLRDMRAAGLCSLKVTSFDQTSSIGLCDESSVSLECMNDKQLNVGITLRSRLSDLPTQSLPDLHDIDMALSEERLLNGLKALIQRESYRSVFLYDGSLSTPPSFGCMPGYMQLPQSTGCVLCPAGSFSSGGECSPCHRDTFQAEEGQVFCTPCPTGTSTVAQGAFSPSHCLTKCHQSNLKCTNKGDFLMAQIHPMSGKWLCVTSQGEELSWTSSDGPMTVEECQVMEKFEVLFTSSLLKSESADILSSDSSSLPTETQLRKCVLDCAHKDLCQHVSIFKDEQKTYCTLYSTNVDNVDCGTSQQNKGFLGNDGAETFRTLSCVWKIKEGDEPNLIVLRKKGHEFSTAGQKSFERLSFGKSSSGVYRTLVFDATTTTLADVHRFCVNFCSRENCCDGFILNQNVLNGGSVMCGLLSSPSVLQCSDKDWDVSGAASASRICGAGVEYNKQQKRFTFSFGGQNFTISDAALTASSTNKSGYQETLISFQRVYLWRESDMNTRPKSSSACSGSVSFNDSRITISDSVKDTFDVLEETSVKVDPDEEHPSQLYWIFKHQYTFQEAQLWCLKRCEEEELCHVSDIRDEGPLYFECVLYPDTRVCGAYDKPLREACSLVLARSPESTHQKKISLTGSVKSFYSRVPFQKMVSYSVRNRVSMASQSITEGFFECERRCDEDQCCRGIGYVRDSGVPGSDVLCLTLNSLGIQTCGENDATNWRIQDCSPSKVQTEVHPFGWYEKPVNQWTKSPSVCPRFSLRSPSKNVDLQKWKQLDSSSVQVDSSLSDFDIVHISRDIAEDMDKVKDWCFSACEESESCSAVSIHGRESAVRCVMYPDMHTCLPTNSGQRCSLVIKEPADSVYIRTGLEADLTSVSIPDHGTLIGGSEVKPIIGSDSKRVSYFRGVPYARPPIRELRFSPPQPADWTSTWNATFSRPSCLQPGDISDSSSEDCLYLNLFVPSSTRKDASVLVFFHNSGSDLLDGSYLAAAGNIIVVTASFRVAAFGFLSTGSNALPGNYGLQDQAAVLGWVQKNIALFGGDPTKVTVGGERNGADVASLHLTSPSASSLFRRALLMGGSLFSPAVVMSAFKAQAQTASLAKELSCTASDITQLLTCLRNQPAQSINAAQTKLLAVSGPFQAWSPVVDVTVVRENPSAALKSGRFHRADVLLGSSVEDGLISRAKNIKNFEQLQGRTDSKTAFYEALSNSLGGDDANAFVKEAATWFYALQHSPTASGYSVFSRALENATRDLFIICPAVDMAEFWASNTQSSVYLYHLPEDTASNSVDLSVPMDVQYLFGVPLDPEQQDLFSSEERTLSLQIMNYMANFIKSGNPNLPLAASRTSFSKFLPPWPQFMSHPGGRGYKEMSSTLNNHKNLQNPQCSFWSQYVPALMTSTAKLSCGTSAGDRGGIQTPTQEPKPLADSSFFLTPSKPKSEKDAYS
ncbi:thyroglobulin [Triplophysa dalaica]|uniref:thyroglobulin n=1 Tax=Triplophysa dalaica TaxID=1582913 RepID=UPI0024DF7633|nr:thyroglobulin [Triplophysa dalaica]